MSLIPVSSADWAFIEADEYPKLVTDEIPVIVQEEVAAKAMDIIDEAIGQTERELKPLTASDEPKRLEQPTAGGYLEW